MIFIRLTKLLPNTTGCVYTPFFSFFWIPRSCYPPSYKCKPFFFYVGELRSTFLRGYWSMGHLFDMSSIFIWCWSPCDVCDCHMLLQWGRGPNKQVWNPAMTHLMSMIPNLSNNVNACICPFPNECVSSAFGISILQSNLIVASNWWDVCLAGYNMTMLE